MVGLALPVLVLGIPIFDTLFSMLRRFLDRRSIFSPDRSHFHHRLLAFGLSQRHVVITIYALTLLAVGLGMFMLLTRDKQTIIVFVCILVLILLAFRAVGAVRLRETIAGLRRRYAIAHKVKQEMEDFEQVELYFRQAEIFDRWWEAVCFASDRMGFVKSFLPLTNRDGSERLLAWERAGENTPAERLVKTVLAIPDRRAGSLLNLEVQVRTDGSLESAGRRIALFGRLLEEYGIVNLPANSRKTSASNPPDVMAERTSAKWFTVRA